MSVIFYGCISLDGYLADKNHGLEWLHSIGSEAETSYNDFYKDIDIVIMGRKTFSEIEHLAELDSIYDHTENFVFSHRDDIESKMFHVVSGDIVTFVKSLSIEKNIWIIGGNTILGPLLDAGLVDKMYVQIAPVLLGEGIPLFTQGEGVKQWNLVETNQYGQFSEMVLEK